MRKFLLLSILFCCLPATRVSAGIPGDTNGNGIVTIADVVTIVNNILEITVNNWNEENADVNNDDAVTVSDITSIVHSILYLSDYSDHKGQSITKISDRLIAHGYSSESGKWSIDVKLDNSNEYSCLQAEVEVPEGMTVTGVSGGKRSNGHQLLYNITDDGLLKVVFVSFANVPFLQNDFPLFTIEGTANENCGNLNIRNIIAANTDFNNYELGFSGGLNENPTRVGNTVAKEVTVIPVADGVEVHKATGQTITVYTIGGELFKTVVAAADYERIRLQKGVYIVTVGSLAVKVIV